MQLQDFLRNVPLQNGIRGHIISSNNEATFGAKMEPAMIESFISHLSDDGRASAEIKEIEATGVNEITIYLNC